jgi:hypothetical protein
MIHEVKQKARTIADLCRRYHVHRLELFGSAATGAFNPISSDLDFLVEFEDLAPGAYADAYFGLLEELQGIFRRKVDLVVARSVKNPYLLEMIRQSKALLYAA